MIDFATLLPVILLGGLYLRERTHRLRLSYLADSLNTKLGDSERVCEELTRALCDEQLKHVEMRVELEAYRAEDVGREERVWS